MFNHGGGRFVRRLSIEHMASPAKRAEKPLRKVGFVGVCAGAGSTTLALAAAEWLAGAGAAERRMAVTALELSPASGARAGSPYDQLGCDRRFAGRGFASYYRLAKDGGPLPAQPQNLSGAVNWALRVPGEGGAHPGTAGLVRLLHTLPGDMVLCDVSAALLAEGRDTARDILSGLDRILCVVDPQPSRLLASVRIMEDVRAAEARGVPVSYIVNKMSAGVNLRELTRFLALKDPVFIPALPAETIHAAEYGCRTLATEPALAEAFTQLFQPR
ncbi:MAG: hypothetical protein LBR44_12455 [Clostridiales Family XIII bacterium]|jgi:hypothetical protein|nr:hypothetical protein [Clostridiales Family XIII bacterium]